MATARSRWRWTAAIALGAALGACRGDAGGVAGRWERVDQPREWVRFERDGTFTGRGFVDTVLIRGRYEQRGDTVTSTSAQGYSLTLTLQDGVLVMEDGTRYRRAEGER